MEGDKVKTRSKKLSLKDYKAKKEAEKQKKLESESGSECSSETSSTVPSRVNSKEPSPEQTVESNVEQVSDVEMEERLNSDNVMEEGDEVDMEGTTDLYISDEMLQGFDVLDELDPQER